MRVNVYTEELLEAGGPTKPTMCEIVHADYVSSRNGQPMRNYGIRVYLKSAPELHYVPPRDDDRSAVTFWCGSKEKDCISFLELLRDLAYASTLNTWREKTTEVQNQAEMAISRSPLSELRSKIKQLREQGMSEEREKHILYLLEQVTAK